jgi:hypothetical protein
LQMKAGIGGSDMKNAALASAAFRVDEGR